MTVDSRTRDSSRNSTITLAMRHFIGRTSLHPGASFNNLLGGRHALKAPVRCSPNSVLAPLKVVKGSMSSE